MDRHHAAVQTALAMAGIYTPTATILIEALADAGLIIVSDADDSGPTLASPSTIRGRV